MKGMLHAETRAVATRSGDLAEVIFHTDCGSIHTSDDCNTLCEKLGIRQSMRRVG
jgi:hypothetical protein